MKLKYLLTSVFCFLLFSQNIIANEKLKKVSVQLEWKHQFEFAGFYMAKEKGYYKNLGLDVDLKEFHNSLNVVDDVLQGKSTFGISSSSLILEKLQNKPVVLLASYFKQNVLALVSKPDIKSISDLKDKKIMALDWELNHTSLGVMLKENKIGTKDYIRVEHDFTIDKFINGEVDAMSIFLTSQLYQLEKLKIPYNILNPAHFGIYSYDLELFTSKNFLLNELSLTKAFVEATRKGWEYAFLHKKETVNLIYNKYTQRKSKEALLYEAYKTEKLFKKDIFKIGSVVPELLKVNLDMYAKLGLVQEHYDLTDTLKNYIYDEMMEYENQLVFTKEEKEYIKNKKLITIGMMSNFKPFSFVENGIHYGLSKDILNKISLLTGLKFQYKIDNWSKILDAFKNKQIDMISGISYMKERENFTLYTEPFYTISTYLFGVKENNSYKDISTIQGKKVGISKDIFYKDTLKELGADIYEYESSLEKVDALVIAEIDYFLSSFTSGKDAINQKGITNIKPLGELKDIKKEDLRYGVVKENQILHSIITKSLAHITQNEYDYFINKWIMNFTPPEEKRINLTKAEKDYLEKKKEIRYCTDPSWMPFEMIENGKHIGIAADYVAIFQEKVGIPFRLVETDSWLESIDFVEKGKCDILSFAVMKTISRDKYLNFTTPHLSIPLVLASNLDVAFITDFIQLIGKKIAIPAGYAFEEILEAKYPQLDLIKVKNVKEGLQKVKDKEVFGYIGTLATIGHLFQKEFTGELKIVAKFDDTWDLSIGVKDDEDILLDILQKTTDTIDTSTKQNILNKWIAINYGDKIDYSLIWKIAIFILSILALVLYWNRKLQTLNNNLEYQKKKADRALKIKSNFLSNISHEIRTPMNAIIGMTYLVKEKVKDEKQKEQLENIESASHSLLRLLNDILDVSKMEEGKIKIVNDTFDMGKLLNNIYAISSSIAKEKGLLFEILYSNRLPKELYTDSLRLEQILTNLVTNAIKFTNEGYVKLEIDLVENTKVRFLVKDTGIGMTQEQIKNIFMPFTQADETTTRKFGGSGLGLAIVKQLVELMGSKVYVESTIDKGTSIYFDLTLPLSKIEKKFLHFDLQSERMEAKKSKEKLELKKEKLLLKDLHNAVKRNRPNLCKPIIDLLDNYELNLISEKEFEELKSDIKRYRFKEAKDILLQYENK